MEDKQANEVHPGLDGVYATEGKVCKVDGLAGKLYYRGYSIESLTTNSNFEEVSYLLLYGKLPNERELTGFKNDLIAHRKLSKETVRIIKMMSKNAHPMDVLRTAVSALPAEDPHAYDSSEEDNLRKAKILIAQMASIVAAIGRAREGKRIIKPDSKLSHTDNFYYMLTGKKPEQKISKFMDTMFMLQAEHSTNASTFATLVAGSTLADIYSAITSGIATLKGPLHGGADEAALKMIRAIGKPDNTEKYIEEALAGKQKIMGFGHRVYKTYDPRAKILRAYLTDLQQSATGEVKDLVEISLRAEKMMIEKLGQSHGIWPNVDFFTGPLYVWAGVDPDIFTPIFAASRISGWSAHMIEYWEHNKIFRPLEVYTGQTDLEYVPIDKR